MVIIIAVCILLMVDVARTIRLRKVLPARARAALNAGDLAAERELLEKIIKTPALLPGAAKRNARFRMAAICMAEGRYAEAAQECRTMLAEAAPPAERLNVRRRLAECLDGMGDADGAIRERNQIEKALQAAPETPNTWMTRGDELKRVQRFAEAAAAYERALEGIPHSAVRGRGRAMVKLALTYFEAGEPSKAVEWGERAAEQPLEPNLLTLAHRIAGLGYSSLGWLDKAEAHHRKGFETARQAKNQAEVGKNLVQLAHVQELRGNITEALQTCQQGAVMINGPDLRVMFVVQAECFRHLGQLSDARDILVSSRNSSPLAMPSLERRSQATIALGLSWIEADAGDAQEAWSYLQEATRVFMRDAKMNVTCEATESWILALLGRKEEAVSRAEAVRARVSEWSHSRRTAQGCCSMPGRAYYALQDWSSSRDCWEQYLTLKADPVFLPMAFWYIGECSLCLNEPERARDAFAQAVSAGAPTHYASLARARLEQR